MTQTIYGASDDLIEMDGDVYEEFNVYLDGSGYLALSDGTQLEVRYTEGGWRFNLAAPTTSDVRIIPARGEDAGRDEDGCPGYSDKVIIDANIEWIIFTKSEHIARRRMKS